MSASFIWIAWCCAIGLPNVTRSCEYASAAVERGARHPDCPRRNVDAADLERTEDVSEPATGITEERVGGDSMVDVRHLDGLDALVAELAGCSCSP